MAEDPADDPSIENNADITVYDLAERISKGQQMSSQAEKEVSLALTTLRLGVTEIVDSHRFLFQDNIQQEAADLLQLRAELLKLLGVPDNR